MHYYTKNIADFNNATRHLTRQERSIYSDLLELQYDLEHPIPDDLDWICRRILAFSESERTDVERMLNEYFDSVEQGFSNARAEREINHFIGKREKAIAAGKASGEARKRNKKPAKTRRSNIVEQPLNERLKDVEPTNNQELITKKYIPEDFTLAEFISEGVLQVVPKAKKPNLESWADTIRLMRERDGLEHDEIQSVFEWANDDNFWQMNILSPSKLREQFPRLQAEMNKKSGGSLSWD